MGFQWFMGFADCCKPPKSHPRRKRKEPSPKVIIGYREPGHCTGWGWNRSPWNVQGTKEANSQHMRVAMSKTGYMCALRLLLCSCKQGDMAPLGKGMLRRDASSHGGKSSHNKGPEGQQRTTGKSRLQTWQKDTENPEGFLSVFQEPRKLLPERTQPSKLIVRNGKDVFWT